jgi:hypothetical protein
METSGQLSARATLFPKKKPRYLIYRRLIGLRAGLGTAMAKRKFLPCKGLKIRSRKTDVSELNGRKHSQNLICSLAFSLVQFLFVTVYPKYLNIATFSMAVLAIFMLWYLLIICIINLLSYILIFICMEVIIKSSFQLQSLSFFIL